MLKRKKFIAQLSILLFCTLGISNLLAQEKTRVLIIFDGSNSMNAQWESSSKISIARQLLTKTVNELRGLENVELALRMYGHQTRIMPGQQDCNDTKLEVPFNPNLNGNIDKIISRIRSLDPKGTTPIAQSLEFAAQDFPKCKNCSNAIILITDGIEACDGDPCAVARMLKTKGIQVQPFVIGIGLDLSYLEHFSCIGNFFDVTDEKTFDMAMQTVMEQAISHTSVQVNLNNTSGAPRETDVPMSFYDKRGQLTYTFEHTLNSHGKPDTLSVNPLKVNRIVVHTIPPLEKSNLQIKPRTRNIIEFNAPMGYLDFKTQGSNNRYPSIKCIVRKHGEMETMHIQELNSAEKYLTGIYDLEILTLPRIKMSEVQIKQSRHTDIVIPRPGILVANPIQETIATIFQIVENEETFVVNLRPQGTQQLLLQPGDYKLVYRKKRYTSAAKVVSETFSITSGQTTELNPF